MIPSTSISFRRNDAAAVEITALAAGAGPPANRIATRFSDALFLVGEERGPVMHRLPERDWCACAQGRFYDRTPTLSTAVIASATASRLIARLPPFACLL